MDADNPKPGTSSVCEVADESQASLTGVFDFEPCLEFDDTELSPIRVRPSANFETKPTSGYPKDDFRNQPLCLGILWEVVESHNKDNFIFFPDHNLSREDYTLSMAEETMPPVESPYRTICGNDLPLMESKVLEVFGDDNMGRRIIVVSACRIPDVNVVPSNVLLEFFIRTLDHYVEQDYTLIYFHYGLTKNNRPPYLWFWNAYKEFDKKYKKNLKALYIVHPTKWVRTLWTLLKPIISIKFGKKINYFNYLHELKPYIDLKTISIPNEIIEHDNRLLVKDPKAAEIACTFENRASDTPTTCQFGVTLSFIQQHHPKRKDYIPPVMVKCIEYLSQPDMIETVGIFRRSADARIIKELRAQCNHDEDIVFTSPHTAAVLLKTFFRELQEPILTFSLFGEVCSFLTWPEQYRLQKISTLIIEKLPFENYMVLKGLVDFLAKVNDRACMNKMNYNNLAIVFGPNLVWPRKGTLTMENVLSINAFTEYMLRNHQDIFIITSIK